MAASQKLRDTTKDILIMVENIVNVESLMLIWFTKFGPTVINFVNVLHIKNMPENHVESVKKLRKLCWI